MILYRVFGLWLMVLLIWQLILMLFGFKKETKDYADHDPESRFMVLVPAHNEERVIGDIIRNLQEMDYPKDKYDFWIVADNCTDGTAEKARSLGANVIETRKEGPDAPTGKPIALRKALAAIENYQDRYDLLMIFDADNLIDKNMFREVNSQYLDKNKPDFIQCYLGCKNKGGIVAWFYYTAYTVTNRFSQLARHRLGLNCAIGGTGFAMSVPYLWARGGWTTRSLTEDFEMQVEGTAEGRRILWNHTTRVWDEKPTKLRASIRQRTRWGQGHWFVALTNTGRLFRALFAGKIRFAEFFSTLSYMWSVSVYIVSFVQLLLSIGMLIAGTRTVSFSLRPADWLITAALFLYSFFFAFYYCDWVDNGIRFSWKTVIPMFLSLFTNVIVSVFQQIGGLLRWRHQQQWVKTEHMISCGEEGHT